MRLKFPGILPLSLALIAHGCVRDDGFVRVLPDQTFQTIRAWEATAWAGGPQVPQEVRDELLDSAAELGITRLRLEVRSGAEQPIDNWSLFQAGELEYEDWRCERYATVNDNDDPQVIDWDGFHFTELDERVETIVLPYAERLKRRGGMLQVNVNYVAFTGQICDGEYFHADRIDEYAEFALAAHLHLRDKYGLIPDAWEMILEPDNGTHWTPAHLAEAVVLTGRLLEENGFKAHIIAPSTTSMGGGLDWLQPILERPEARRFLWEASYHRYKNKEFGFAQRWGALSAEGVPTAMLELIGADHETLYVDLAVSQVSSWQQYALGGPGPGWDRGGLYFLLQETTDGEYVIRPGFRTNYLRPFMRNVRPGAVRIGTEVTHPNHRAVAFTNRDGRRVVGIWYENSGRVTVEGLEPGRHRVIWVNPDGTQEETRMVQNSTEVLVEGRGVVVLVALTPGS